MVATWQCDCTAVTLASGCAEMDPCSVHTGDSSMGLCPEQEFQQKSEFKCKAIPHWWMWAQGVRGALEQSSPLVCSGFRTSLANGASLRMPSGWDGSGLVEVDSAPHLSPVLTPWWWAVTQPGFCLWALDLWLSNLPLPALRRKTWDDSCSKIT